MPQWKKELILRRQNKTKCQSSVGQLPCSVGLGDGKGESNRVVSLKNQLQCDVFPGTSNSTMVQERVWSSHREAQNGDKKSDSDEDLQYGPGIVSKLKNRYLSLALRETDCKTRPTLLHMRKAASLEHILDEEEDNCKTGEKHLYESRVNGKSVTNRYGRSLARGDLKRARSVETISRTDEQFDVVYETRSKRESLHQEMLILTEGNDKPWKIEKEPPENNVFICSSRINRPRRITPIMSEKEKPPVNIVKQAKMIYERRPEVRPTGEVAAKVATFKNIICQSKSKKPLIRQKPLGPAENKARKSPVSIKTENRKSKPAPLIINKSPEPPDVSKINDFQSDNSQLNQKPATSLLCETPDLLVYSSPNCLLKKNEPVTAVAEETSKESCNTSSKIDNLTISNCIELNGIANKPVIPNGENKRNKIQQTEKTETNGEIIVPSSPKQPTKNITEHQEPKVNIRELEKNLINRSKCVETVNSKVIEVNSEPDKVPKPRRSVRKQEDTSCSIVFKFTDRKEVPDYVGNDGRIQQGKIEKPKVNIQTRQMFGIQFK